MTPLLAYSRLRAVTPLDREAVPDEDALTAAAWQRLHQPLLNLDDLIKKWDLNTRQGLVGVPPLVQEDFGLIMRSLWSTMYEVLHEDTSELSKSERDSLGERLGHILAPIIVSSRFAERALAKPLGYAGDYLTIEMIYNDEPCGTGALGLLLDRSYLEADQAVAVRNRRNVMADQILSVIRRSSEKGDEPARILSLACGPAREIFDVCNQLDSSNVMKATLVDLDQSALTYVSSKLSERRFNHQFDLVRANIAFLSIGKGTLDIPPQDLVYSIGLIDYFKDSLVVKLLNFMYDVVMPGGRVIIGNVHTSNVNRPILDYTLVWSLIHRNETDINRLFQASKFGRCCDAIIFEDCKNHMFAIMDK